MDSILKIIKTVPLFEGLETQYLSSIALIAQKRTCKKGEIIFNEGEKGNGFYVVQNGSVKIFKTSFGGKEQILHIYGAGKPFGEVPVFTGKNFPASAVALSSAELIFFPRKNFIALITENPLLSLNMLAVLSMRLHQFTVMVENLALKEVPARLASYLLVLLKEQHTADINSEKKDHKLSSQTDNAKQKKLISRNLPVIPTINLPVSKNQLAGLLGTTPETISRVFAKFISDKIIQVDRNLIIISDIEQLEYAAYQ